MQETINIKTSRSPIRDGRSTAQDIAYIWNREYLSLMLLSFLRVHRSYYFPSYEDFILSLPRQFRFFYEKIYNQHRENDTILHRICIIAIFIFVRQINNSYSRRASRLVLTFDRNININIYILAICATQKQCLKL